MKIVNVLPTGSRVICVPPPMDTDADYLILVDEALDSKEVFSTISALGFEYSGNRCYASNGEQKPFMAWRRGDINWIVTDDPNYFRLFGVATELARRLNVLDKEDRIAIFQAVLYGETHNIHQL